MVLSQDSLRSKIPPKRSKLLLLHFSHCSCIAFTLACMEMEAFSTGKAEEPKPRKNKHTNNNKKHTQKKIHKHLLWES